MRTKTKLKVLAAATLLALAPLAYADDAPAGSGSLDNQVKVLDNTGASRGQAQVAARIAAQFRGIAGSDANALALVNGLRNGTSITLTTTTTSKPTTTGAGTTPPAPTTTATTIAPPTKPMGWGNVRIALALAQAELQQAGITKPTAQQLQIALTGGSLKSPSGTTTQVQGVLTLRASGMGWGQIAQAQGTKLGPVLASLRQTQHEVAKLPVRGDEHHGAMTAANGKGGEHEGEHEGRKGEKSATSSKTPAATPSGGSSKSTTLTTASGATPQGQGSKGVVTASGSTSSSRSSKGLTTASGVAPSSASKGIVTAEGIAGAAHGAKSQGKGIVTAGGGSVNVAATSAKPSTTGAGITTATGAAAAGTGVTTAQGGSGEGNGHGKGKGGG